MSLEATADLDLRELDSAFASMLRGARDLTPAWRDLAPLMREDQLAHFRAQEGPNGAWAPLAKATIGKTVQLRATRKLRPARAKSGRGKRRPSVPPQRKSHEWRERSRIFSSKMANAMFLQWRPLELAAVSKIPWAAAHQEGATVGRGSKLPARPFMYLSAWFVRKAVERLRAHLVESFRSGRRFRR